MKGQSFEPPALSPPSRLTLEVPMRPHRVGWGGVDLERVVHPGGFDQFWEDFEKRASRFDASSQAPNNRSASLP